MTKFFCGTTPAALCIASNLALAGDFDGSRPLLCATMESHDCDAGETCQRGLPESVGAPQFMRLDFKQQVIVGPNRNSPIKLIERSADQLLLQGTELGIAWTLAIDTSNGKLRATLVNRDSAIVVFGACTPL